MKRKKMTALLCAAALLCAVLGGCGTADEIRSTKAVRGESIQDAILAMAEAVEFPSSDGIHVDVDYADMAWYIYDAETFLQKADRLARTADDDEAIRLYKWLMAEYRKVNTLDSLAYIDFYAHPNDETVSNACLQLDAVQLEVNNALVDAIANALEGPAGHALRTLLGEERANAFVGYEEQTDRESEIAERISELTLQYNTLIMENLTFGEETEKIGTLYRELVDLRNEEAQIAGYDSYAAYAYELYYWRDYTPEDAAALCEAVKPYAQKYFTSLYTHEATYVGFSEKTRFSKQELVELLTRFMPRISSEAGEAAEYMKKHGLYFMDSAYRVSDLGFTTTLDMYNAPFIYLALYGSEYDVESIFHEFGHYYDAYLNPIPDSLLSVGSMDVFEIHSTGMEALSTNWFDEIYGGDADLARIRFLDSTLYSIFTGCLFDEFQREVYADPSLTPEQISQRFASVARSYGMRGYDKDFSHYWMDVSHNFESPFYYISYAVSTLASLQIYEIAENDWKQAAEFYNDIVSLGAYEHTYCELLEEVGLECFTDGLPACVEQAVTDLEELCFAWEKAA